ncbi:MAG: hypothetical protein HY848_06660 [Betaproteobacteria bacterium]|nr:hypothetical protein [Betaproteobacteria bacterium]
MDVIERLGHHPVLSHPKQTEAIAAARIKNDPRMRNGSRKTNADDRQ